MKIKRRPAIASRESKQRFAGDLANPAFIAPLAEAFDADTGIDKIYEISGQPYKEYPTRQAARRALEKIGGPEAEAALEERRDQRDEE